MVTQLSQLTSGEKLIEMSDQIGALNIATDGIAATNRRFDAKSSKRPTIPDISALQAQ